MMPTPGQGRFLRRWHLGRDPGAWPVSQGRRGRKGAPGGGQAPCKGQEVREHAGMRPKTISPGWSGEGTRRNQKRQERFWGQTLRGVARMPREPRPLLLQIEDPRGVGRSHDNSQSCPTLGVPVSRVVCVPLTSPAVSLQRALEPTGSAPNSRKQIHPGEAGPHKDQGHC